jgi:hypothetical protein
MAKKIENAASSALANELRKRALAKFPGSHLKSPWPGHLDLAVKDKTYAYVSVDGQPFHISCRLVTSGPDVLMLPNAEPAGYGLGKSGWVAVSFGDDDLPPIEMLEAWLEESYRTQAPKTLVKQLDGAPAPANKMTAAKKTAAKKTTAKKTGKKPAKKR